ncbi:hypothetical protein B484DRAFT_405498, partial [Ochromonadaceae sp. CCMP2298]
KAETHTISDAGGFAAGYFHCLTLKVHSSLESVGLTATNSKLFAEAGIPAKIDAGFYHNHVFVPSCKSSHALAILNDCSSAAVVSSPLVLESSGVPSNAPSLAMVKEGKGKKRTSEAQLVSVAEAETELTDGQKLTALDVSDSEDEGAEDEYYKHTAGGSGSIFSKKGAVAPITVPAAATVPVAAGAAAIAAPTAAGAAAPTAASTPAPAAVPTPASASALAAVLMEGKRRRGTLAK